MGKRKGIPVEKLPSGNYRISKSVDGHRYRMTLDHKPTQKEAFALMAELIQKPISKDNSNKTVRDAMLAYIDLYSNVQSPRTVQEGLARIKRLPEWFLSIRLYDLDQNHVQKLVSDLSVNHAPKTVLNIFYAVQSACKTYRKELDLSTVQKPKKTPQSIDPPSREEVMEALGYLASFEEGKYLPAIFLAACGLRRGEILAITAEDIDENDCLHISKAMVQDKDKNWVLKAPKTPKSVRTIKIDHEIAEMIRERGFAYKGDPGMLEKTWRKACLRTDAKKAYRLHDLRHFWASEMLQTHTFLQVMESGGWATSTTLTRVYAHAMGLDEARVQMGRETSALLSTARDALLEEKKND